MEDKSEEMQMPLSRFQCALPAGVASFEEWGRTRIEFGKYDNQGMSYGNLASSHAPECLKYKAWCIQRVKTSTGLLKDLTDYLMEYDRRYRQHYGPETAQSPFIPGTDRLRVLM